MLFRIFAPIRNETTMRLDIISVIPEMMEGFLNHSILSRAQKKGIVEIHLHNLHDYATDHYKKV